MKQYVFEKVLKSITKVFENKRTRNFRYLLSGNIIVNGKVKKTTKKHQLKRQMLPMLQQKKHNVL